MQTAEIILFAPSIAETPRERVVRTQNLEMGDEAYACLYFLSRLMCCDFPTHKPCHRPA